MSKILVGGVETFSTVDFPEHLSAVVFMQGCPWRCPFCHNHDLQTIGKPTEFLWEKFVSFLQTRRGILDAVVFSGGEPLVQDNLADAVAEVKEMGFKVGLHTGGYRPGHLKKVLPLLDWVGFDVKAPFEAESYRRLTGAPHLQQALESLDMLLNSGVDFECRTTCDPRFLSCDDLAQMGDELASRGVKKYFLQKYRPIESDTTTTDSDCEKFFDDKALIEHLRNLFEQFDIRR